MLIFKKPAIACNTAVFDIKNNTPGEVRKDVQIHVEG